MIEFAIFKLLVGVFALLVISIIMFACGYFVGKEDGIRERVTGDKPKYSYKQWKKDNPNIKF